MLYFDDQAVNSDVEMWQGVTFHKVEDGNFGLNMAEYYEGLDVWRRNQDIRCPMPTTGPDPLPNARRVGWDGTDSTTSERYRQGKRRLKSNRPARWGWGLYIADDASIAAAFAKWRRNTEPWNLYVCKVFVRDFEVFKRMAKVWVPEFGSVPQTTSDLGGQHIAEAQIARDRIIMEEFGVCKPYILFARHHWMDLLGETWRVNHQGRFSEMVVPPQVQDALFYGEPWRLSDAQPHIDGGHLEGYDFRHRLREWHIKRNTETEMDFWKHGEDYW